MLPKDIVVLFLISALQISNGYHMDNETNPEIIFESETCFCNEQESLLIYTEKDSCKCKCIIWNTDLHCDLCPDEFRPCAKQCCYTGDLECTNDGFCRSPGELDFVTAAKVAVLFALIVTCIAVLVALFRSFCLSRWCGGRGRLAQRRLEPERISLNSVNRYIQDRLRLRPPAYDHQPEKPPSYEDCVNCEEPPAYGIAVVSEGGEPPPPYNVVLSDHQTVELQDSLEPQERNESSLVLDVRTLPQTASISQTLNHEENGLSNRGFEWNDEINRNDHNNANTT